MTRGCTADLPLRRRGAPKRERERVTGRVAALAHLWPVATIDFEANGLGIHTYPIEVGVCTWPEPHAPVAAWSRLIRPLEEWTARPWQASAQAMHGLRPEDLAEGIDPADAASEIAARAGNATLRCDGMRFDRIWLEMLHAGTGSPVPKMDDLRPLEQAGPGMAKWRGQNRGPHRAGPDALVHVMAFAYALGLKPALVDDIGRH